jgi:hypothetical protein
VSNVDLGTPADSDDDVGITFKFGYDYAIGGFVLGTVTTIETGNFTVDEPSISADPTDVDNTVRVGVRAGYSFGSGLAYATGGYATLDVTGFGGIEGSFVGLGYEQMLPGSRSSVAIEYTEHDFDEGKVQGFETESVNVGVNFRF